VSGARRELRSCQAFLDKYFAAPVSVEQQEAKRMAARAMDRLAGAARNRDASEIARHSKSLTKIMVYLWAVTQHHDSEH